MTSEATVPVRRPHAEPPADPVALEVAPDRPDPSRRKRRDDIDGTPVSIGEATWLLADFVPELGDVWDRIHDHNLVRGRYEPLDVQLAALRLLMANYHLNLDEAVWLILSARLADLVEPVERALFGVDRPYRGWSGWIELSLWSNGIDPAKVPPSKRRDVVSYLVQAGKAIPAEQYLSSHKAAARRQSILDFAERRKARQAPADGAGD